MVQIGQILKKKRGREQKKVPLLDKRGGGIRGEIC
jgi:hypothetical protein